MNRAVGRRLMRRRTSLLQVLLQRGDQLSRLDLIERDHEQETRDLLGALDVLGFRVRGAQLADGLVHRFDHGRVVVGHVRLDLVQCLRVGQHDVDDVVRLGGDLGEHHVGLVLEPVLALDVVERAGLNAVVHDAVDAVESVVVGHTQEDGQRREEGLASAGLAFEPPIARRCRCVVGVLCVQGQQ